MDIFYIDITLSNNFYHVIDQSTANRLSKVVRKLPIIFSCNEMKRKPGRSRNLIKRLILQSIKSYTRV